MGSWGRREVDSRLALRSIAPAGEMEHHDTMVSTSPERDLEQEPCVLSAWACQCQMVSLSATWPASSRSLWGC
eukprot:3874509-Alexandrium_andersonii.AAC.1